jgi:hypothetical protein
VRAYGLSFGPGADPVAFDQRESMREAEKMSFLIQTEKVVRL